MVDLSADQKRKFFEALHRALVILDDWLCDTFGFSRQARGKKARDPYN